MPFVYVQSDSEGSDSGVERFNQRIAARRQGRQQQQRPTRDGRVTKSSQARSQRPGKRDREQIRERLQKQVSAPVPSIRKQTLEQEAGELFAIHDQLAELDLDKLVGDADFLEFLIEALEGLQARLESLIEVAGGKNNKRFRRRVAYYVASVRALISEVSELLEASYDGAVASSSSSESESESDSESESGSESDSESSSDSESDRELDVNDSDLDSEEVDAVLARAEAQPSSDSEIESESDLDSDILVAYDSDANSCDDEGCACNTTQDNEGCECDDDICDNCRAEEIDDDDLCDACRAEEVDENSDDDVYEVQPQDDEDIVVVESSDEESSSGSDSSSGSSSEESSSESGSSSEYDSEITSSSDSEGEMEQY